MKFLLKRSNALGVVLAAILKSSSTLEAAPLGVSDGTGKLLGTFASTDDYSVTLVTSTGYIARVRVFGEGPYSSQIVGLGSLYSTFGLGGYHASSDCSGELLSDAVLAGRVEGDGKGSSTAYYIPTNAAPTIIHAGQSYSVGDYASACYEGTMAQDKTLMPVYPNDPAVTGINEWAICTAAQGVLC